MRRIGFVKQGSVAILCASLAACGGGGSGSEANLTLPTTINTAPQISGAPAVIAQVDQLYQFTPAAADADGDTLTFRIENRPEWATFSPSTGRLEGTPTNTSQASYSRILISVTDGSAISELPPFDLSVQGLPVANTAPAISGTPATSIVAGNTYEFIPQVVDPDGQTLQFAIIGKPSWAAFDPVTGGLSGTPAASDVGSFGGIEISVSDGIASASLPAFSIAVTGGTAPGPTNRAPTISGTPAGSVAAGQAYSFTPTASDPDGQALTFSIANRPSWATFNTATGRLNGTPAAGNVGSFADIVISVSDGAETTSLPAFTISVVAANVAPTIGGTPSTTVTAGQAYSFTPTAADPDGQALTFSIANKPSWATFNTSTGRLNGTPTAAQVGSYSNVSITVSDGAAQATLAPFTIRVVAANGAPTIGGTPATSVTAGQAYSFTPTAADPDGQALTFSITNRPSWATFSTSTGRLNGTPTSAQVGSYSNVTISVSDGAAQTSLAPFTMGVSAAPNQPPTISGTPPTTVTAGQAYSFTPSASDPDGQALTFSIANRPSWATFSTSTGRLNGTPTAAQVGSYSNVTISVSDGAAQTSLAPFTIVVSAAPNQPPTISGTPPTTVTAGQAYSFTPTASDPDGQTLTFSIANRPSWATFNTSTGRLNGTPTTAQAGSYANVTISVSDGTAQASLAPFTIVVGTAAPANQPPTISGSPSTSVTVGQAYSFTPTASDPDGQALTFSIANKPSWASFNTSTGRLNGTPTAANAGTYSGIAISVSDGTASVSLPSFALTVQQVQLGSATIAWTPPTSNEDNSPLTNLRGYRVYYGTSTSNLNQVVDVANAGISSVVIENLSPGTWYFGVRSYNTSNVESALSNLATKTIN
jgi:hypothetical protein